RYGVAMGFSPMDMFKRRAIADSLSDDPVASREDRMGNVMGRVQHFSGGLSWTAVVAPKVSWNSARDRETGLHLSRTNDQWKFLSSLGVRHSRGSTLDVIAYRDEAETVFGAAWTEPIGSNANAYVEWAGGRGKPLGDDQRR